MKGGENVRVQGYECIFFIFVFLFYTVHEFIFWLKVFLSGIAYLIIINVIYFYSLNSYPLVVVVAITMGSK